MLRNMRVALMVCFTASYSWACDQVVYTKAPDQLSRAIETQICELIVKLYPELTTTRLELVDVAGSALMSQFAGERISFLSYFRLGDGSSRPKYFIGFNRAKILANHLTRRQMRAVLAHELAHTLQWMRMGSDWQRIRHSAQLQASFSGLRDFEAQADAFAIRRSIHAHENLTSALIAYRQVNLDNTNSQREREDLLNLYLFENELRRIESYVLRAGSHPEHESK